MSHSFTDANFSRPTYCDHCQGLLWGLVKQGIRCSGKVIQKKGDKGKGFLIFWVSKIVELFAIIIVRIILDPVQIKLY